MAEVLDDQDHSPRGYQRPFVWWAWSQDGFIMFCDKMIYYYYRLGYTVCVRDRHFYK